MTSADRCFICGHQTPDGHATRAQLDERIAHLRGHIADLTDQRDRAPFPQVPPPPEEAPEEAPEPAASEPPAAPTDTASDPQHSDPAAEPAAAAPAAPTHDIANLRTVLLTIGVALIGAGVIAFTVSAWSELSDLARLAALTFAAAATGYGAPRLRARELTGTAEAVAAVAATLTAAIATAPLLYDIGGLASGDRAVNNAYTAAAAATVAAPYGLYAKATRLRATDPFTIGALLIAVPATAETLNAVAGATSAPMLRAAWVVALSITTVAVSHLLLATRAARVTYAIITATIATGTVFFVTATWSLSGPHSLIDYAAPTLLMGALVAAAAHPVVLERVGAGPKLAKYAAPALVVPLAAITILDATEVAWRTFRHLPYERAAEAATITTAAVIVGGLLALRAPRRFLIAALIPALLAAPFALYEMVSVVLRDSRVAPAVAFPSMPPLERLPHLLIAVAALVVLAGAAAAFPRRVRRPAGWRTPAAVVVAVLAPTLTVVSGLGAHAHTVVGLVGVAAASTWVARTKVADVKTSALLAVAAAWAILWSTVHGPEAVSAPLVAAALGAVVLLASLPAACRSAGAVALTLTVGGVLTFAAPVPLAYTLGADTATLTAVGGSTIVVAVLIEGLRYQRGLFAAQPELVRALDDGAPLLFAVAVAAWLLTPTNVDQGVAAAAAYLLAATILVVAVTWRRRSLGVSHEIAAFYAAAGSAAVGTVLLVGVNEVAAVAAAYTLAVVIFAAAATWLRANLSERLGDVHETAAAGVAAAVAVAGTTLLVDVDQVAGAVGAYLLAAGIVAVAAYWRRRGLPCRLGRAHEIAVTHIAAVVAAAGNLLLVGATGQLYPAEAYSVPVAVMLAAAGAWNLSADRTLPSIPLLAAPIVIGVGPTVLAVLGDPHDFVRVGALTAVIAVGGYLTLKLRLRALVALTVTPAAAVTFTFLRLGFDAAPWWINATLAGTALVLTAANWERRSTLTGPVRAFVDSAR